MNETKVAMELSVLSKATDKTGEVGDYSTCIRELEASTFTLVKI